ncbi:MAG: HEAT repeat domain-containing protein [Actinomycetota bacterium]
MSDAPTANGAPHSDEQFVDDLIARAVDAYRQLADEGDLDPIWPLLGQAAALPEYALTRAAELGGSEDARERAVAGLLVGSVSSGRDDGPWRDKALDICEGILADETDADVLWAVAHALGYQSGDRAAALLIPLAAHEDSDVRFKVAMGLPSTFDEDNPDHEIIGALIGLSGDEDEDVRDWATFGLGTVLASVDSDELRAALWARSEDDHADTRNEALAGLANRYETGVVPLLVAELESDDADPNAVHAASILGDARALPALRRLAAHDAGAADADLQRAIERCEPALDQERQAAEQALFQRLLKEAVDNPRFGTKVTGLTLDGEFPRTAVTAWVLSGPEPYEERWSVWGELCGRVTEDGRLAELDIERAVELVRGWTGSSGG